jgi:hypothetical protein
MAHGIFFHQASDLCGSWTVKDQYPSPSKSWPFGQKLQFRIKPDLEQDTFQLWIDGQSKNLTPLKHEDDKADPTGHGVYSFSLQLGEKTLLLGSADGGHTLVYVVLAPPPHKSKNTGLAEILLSRHTGSGSAGRG